MSATQSVIWSRTHTAPAKWVRMWASRCKFLDDLRAAIRHILASTAATGLTRKDIWDALPDVLRRNDGRFKAAIEAGVGGGWRREGSGGKNNPFVYLPDVAG